MLVLKHLFSCLSASELTFFRDLHSFTESKTKSVKLIKFVALDFYFLLDCLNL